MGRNLVREGGLRLSPEAHVLQRLLDTVHQQASERTGGRREVVLTPGPAEHLCKTVTGSVCWMWVTAAALTSVSSGAVWLKAAGVGSAAVWTLPQNDLWFFCFFVFFLA